MRKPDGARVAAPAVLAAVAGTASAGIAALANAGVCVHRALGVPRVHGPGMPGLVVGASMPGMAMPGAAGPPAASTPCPIMLGACIAAAVLCLAAIAAIALLRPSAGEVAMLSARAVVRLRFAPLAALLALAGAVPLGAMLLSDGMSGAPAAFVGGALVAAAALVCAAALLGVARLILAVAHRVADALITALRLLVPGSDGPWVVCAEPSCARAGTLPARRSRSRAPPALP